MASTTPVAALYFIALMTFGNYVLFNLLVAILVEGFQTEVPSYFPYSCGNVEDIFKQFGATLPMKLFFFAAMDI